MSEETKTKDEEFADFFNEATGEKQTSDEDVTEVKKEDEDEVKVKPDDQDSTDAIQTEGAEKDDVDTTDPETEDPNWEARFKEMETENEKLKHKMSSWEGRITAANTAKKLAEQALAEAQAKETKTDDADGVSPSTDDEEDAALKEFQAEFPDLVKPLKIMAKRYAKQTADAKFDIVAPKVEKLEKKAEKSESEFFYAPITEAHPDWKHIYESGELNNWIDTLKPLQKRVFLAVIGDGSQKEIIDMFDEYKAATNEQSTTNTSKNTTDKVTEGTTTDSVKDIVAVPGQSAGPPADGPDKSDFDSAWKEANLQ
jgi:hypothetical protein